MEAQAVGVTTLALEAQAPPVLLHHDLSQMWTGK